jgi:hypothetical protein
MPLAKAERTMAAWGFYSYGVDQAPAPGRGGLVVTQYPPAGTRSVPANTSFVLIVGVSYHATADVKLESCLTAGPGVSSPTGVGAAQYPPRPSVPVDFSSTGPGAWRAFGLPSLIAPQGWRCSGFVAEDGGNNFTVVPPGELPPSPMKDEASEHKPVPEIAISGEPACQSCVFGIACAYFPASRDDGTYPPCHIPAGETYRRVNAEVVDFTDPPGVKGAGEPSGGADPAVGAVVYKLHSAAVITCILPLSQVSICRTAVHAFTTYESAMGPVGEASIAPVHKARQAGNTTKGSLASAQSLLAAALAAVRAQHGARLAAAISIDSMPAVSVASTVLAGTTSGTAWTTYTVSNGTKSSKFHGQVVLSNGTVFFKGDAGAWYFEMSIMGGPGITQANRWVAISSKCTSGTRQECKLFQRLASGLTVRTAMSPVAMTGPLSLLPPTTVLGQRVVGIRGTTAKGIRTPAVPEVVYVREGGTPLPVEAVQAALSNSAGTWTFRFEWAKVSPVGPPSPSVPFNPRWLGNP